MAKRYEYSYFELSKNWFNWSYENYGKASPSHCGFYFFLLDHCNRLGWPEKFGLPTSMAMAALQLKNFKTYVKLLDDLSAFGFVKIVQKSRNQHTATVVALVKNTVARYEHGRGTVEARSLARYEHGEYNNTYNTNNTNNTPYDFSSFINLFNSLTGGKFKGDKKCRRQFEARKKEGVKLDDYRTAITNLNTDTWHRENGHVHPEFITRSDKLDKWLNTKPMEKKENKPTVTDQYGNSANYSGMTAN